MSHDLFWFANTKIVSHESILIGWLKTLNAMDNVNMSCVLFIWCKGNVYNKENSMVKS